MEPPAPIRGIPSNHAEVAMNTTRRLGLLILPVSLLTAWLTTSPVAGGATQTRARHSQGQIVVRGAALLDGQPFDSEVVGAIVLRSGLATPCQAALPPVTNGRYAVPVFNDRGLTGCGAPGALIVLWVAANQTILYSTNAAPWPQKSSLVDFAPQYSTAAPHGAAPELAEFNGSVFDRGHELGPGTKVEAYVGSTRCAVAAVRRSPDFVGYILAVIGPDSVPGCLRGSPLTFRINGHPAAPTGATNTPPGQRESLDLTLAR